MKSFQIENFFIKNKGCVGCSLLMSFKLKILCDFFAYCVIPPEAHAIEASVQPYKIVLFRDADIAFVVGKANIVHIVGVVGLNEAVEHSCAIIGLVIDTERQLHLPVVLVDMVAHFLDALDYGVFDECCKVILARVNVLHQLHVLFHCVVYLFNFVNVGHIISVLKIGRAC